MNTLNKYRFFFVLFILQNILISGVYSQGGLMFKANDHVIGERTSFNVFQEKSPQFSGRLYINFKISLWDTQNLGYIFNLTTNTNSYSFNYIYSYNQPSLNFNIDGKSNKLRYLLDSAKLKSKKWFDVKFDFHLKEDFAVISIDDHRFQINHLGLTDNISPKLFFGKNQFYSDVPHMSISDLTVGDDHKTYFFPLKEWNGNAVHTSSGETIGYVQNPIWLMDSFYYWKPIFNKEYDYVVGINFDTVTQRFLIYGKDSVLFFNCLNRHVKARSYQNSMPFRMTLGKSVFNYRENKLYVYEARNKTNDATCIASLDMDHLKWQSIGKAQLPERMHHHNVFYDENSDSIFIFGGYGGYKYFNQIFAYNEAIDHWEQVPFIGDTITPRFLSASGNSDKPNVIFLFGGYGNESGNQVVGGHPYYDLYRINLQNHTITKCWDTKINDNFVPTNNLILSEDKKYIYALCYPHGVTKTFLRLYKFSVADGSYEILGSPIPITAERIETDVNLFLDKNSDKLICVIQEFLDSKRSNVKVYSIAYPPIRMSNENNNAENTGFRLKRSLWIAVTLASLCLVVFFIIKNKAKKIRIASAPPAIDKGDEQQSAEPAVQIHKDSFDIRINAVYLLGKFTVFDKKEMDITHLFSPKIKQLFILILLNSFGNTGISSKKISNVLWPDMEISKTKNIKGVTLNHLRKILNHINGIELIFLEDNYLFNISDLFFCDYETVLKSISEVNAPVSNDCFNLICRGILLKDMHDNWLDVFKNEYEKLISKTLLKDAALLYDKKSYMSAIAICSVIMDIDPFNDTALKYLLNSSQKTQGIEYCKKLYYQFTKDYEKSLGEPFNTSLDEILHP